MGASNVKAMREALEFASIILNKWRQDAPFSAWNEYDEAIDRCLTALSAPPRQCDVGTEEEQDERFKNFCLSYYEPCNVDGECWKCPLFRKKTRCPISWAQMPYETEEGGSKK